MIDVTGVDLVEFAKKVYELSVPQGLGFLHFKPEPLTDEEAKGCIRREGNIVLDMDYVNGRACKMVVRSENGKFVISDTWYDHTDKALAQLLQHFGIAIPPSMQHGCACNCMDCQYERSQK